jgi:TolB-like protein
MSSPPATTPGIVFISYASEDSEAARKIADALRTSGVEVWFDVDGGLEHGDEWDAKIRKQIKECVLFIAVISQNTQTRHEGYFRIEWDLAAERARGIASGVPFILPIVIDDTREPAALVPDRFRAVQWTRLPGAVVTPEVKARYVNLWAQRTGRGVDQVSAAPGGSSATQSARTDGRAHAHPAKNRWLLSAIAVLVLSVAAVAIWQPWKSAAPADSLARLTAAPIGAAAALSISDKSLVVLPLENLSPDPENAFFTDGIHSEIIETLTRLSDLKVIRRMSSLEFKNSTAPLAEIAQKLVVANVVTGSVRREKDRVKITLELRRASDEAVLWGPQVYERELKEVFAIQSEIAGDVARVLQARQRKGTFGGAEFMTRDPHVYDLFVRLQKDYRENILTVRSWEGIISAAEELVKLAPNFMPAVARLSTSHTNAFRTNRDSSARVRHAAEAKRWAETASSLVGGGQATARWPIIIASSKRTTCGGCSARKISSVRFRMIHRDIITRLLRFLVWGGWTRQSTHTIGHWHWIR